MNGALQRKGLRALDWLVVGDLTLTETAEFWRTAPEVARGEVRPEDIQTEVFFFPCAAHTEKDGTFTNTQRLLQWHHKAVEPRGRGPERAALHPRPGRAAQEALRGLPGGQGPRPSRRSPGTIPSRALARSPSAEAVLREINGYRVADGALVRGFGELADDGTTACGCWLYSGCYADGVNQAARRKPGQEQTGWPRSGAGPGPPTGACSTTAPPRTPRAGPGASARSTSGGMRTRAAGRARTYPTSSWTARPRTGPRTAPEASRPSRARIPSSCRRTARAGSSPRAAWWTGPCPRTTSRWSPRCRTRSTRSSATRRATTTGAGTIPTTAPGPIRATPTCSPPTGSPSTTPRAACPAGSRGSASCSRRCSSRSLRSSPGRWAWRTEAGATVTTARGEMECRVLVTERMRPLRIDGKTVHQIGMPYHWSYSGRVRGDSANELIGVLAGSECLHPGVQGAHGQHPAGAARKGTHGGPGPCAEAPARGRAGSAERRRGRGSPRGSASSGGIAAHGTERLLHRHHAVHRLQGVRGGLQAVEPAARRWLPAHRHVVRQHRAPGRLHLAARVVHRAARAHARTVRGRGGLLVAHGLGRVQALSAAPGASRRVPRAPSSAPSSTPCTCSPTCATAAATAWWRVPSA